MRFHRGDAESAESGAEKIPRETLRRSESVVNFHRIDIGIRFAVILYRSVMIDRRVALLGQRT